MGFKIDNEFRDLIPALRPEELEGLEQSIKEDGCRDPLIIWEEEGILVDGHNRKRCRSGLVRCDIMDPFRLDFLLNCPPTV